MKKKTIIPITLLIIIALILLYFAFSKKNNESDMVLCSGITLLDNVSSNSLSEYNGYYIKDSDLDTIISANRNSIDSMIDGTYDISYMTSHNETYIIFKNENYQYTAIVITEENNQKQIMFCENVNYSIYYSKGSKGNVYDFRCNEETALTFTVSAN